MEELCTSVYLGAHSRLPADHSLRDAWSNSFPSFDAKWAESDATGPQSKTDAKIREAAAAAGRGEASFMKKHSILIQLLHYLPTDKSFIIDGMHNQANSSELFSLFRSVVHVQRVQASSYGSLFVLLAAKS